MYPDDDFEKFYQLANNNKEYRNESMMTLPSQLINRNRASSLRENTRRKSRRITNNDLASMKTTPRRNADEMITKSQFNEAQVIRKSSASYKASTDLLASNTSNTKYLSPMNQISPNIPSDPRRHSLYPTSEINIRRQLPSISPASRNANIRRGSSPNPGLHHSREQSPLNNTGKIHNQFTCTDSSLSDGKNNIIRVRSFKRTKQGLVNRGDKNIYLGDQIKKADREEVAESACLRSPSISSGIDNESRTDHVQEDIHVKRKTCQVLGALEVGKTVLCKQFLQSESITDHDYDLSVDGEFNNSKLSVEVEVDGVTTSIQITDTTIDSQNLGHEVLSSVDAYVIVYAVDDKKSFQIASEILKLVMGCSKRTSAFILVANKNDLVRSKVVSSEEGKALAGIYNASFFEISVSLNHQIDNLLVGIINAIENEMKNMQKEMSRLSGRLASITPSDVGQFPVLTSRRESLLDTITKSSRGKVVSKFLKKHFK